MLSRILYFNILIAFCVRAPSGHCRNSRISTSGCISSSRTCGILKSDGFPVLHRGFSTHHGRPCSSMTPEASAIRNARVAPKRTSSSSCGRRPVRPRSAGISGPRNVLGPGPAPLFPQNVPHGGAQPSTSSLPFLSARMTLAQTPASARLCLFRVAFEIVHGAFCTPRPDSIVETIVSLRASKK